MNAAWLAFYDGLLAITLIAVGIIGAHYYLVAPFMGFQMFALGFLLSIIGSIVGIVAIIRTRKPERSAGRNRAVVGTVICLVIAVPMIALTVHNGVKYPPINDITTDVDNPPEFIFAQKLQHEARDMKYNKDRYAARQQAGYGTIAPLKEKLELAAEFQHVKEVAQLVPSWKITYSDPATNTFEAVATSGLFHFQDDIVIQIRPTSDGQSLVEMRSKSRDGLGDQGVNARRIRRFFDRLAMARGPAEAQEEMP